MCLCRRDRRANCGFLFLSAYDTPASDLGTGSATTTLYVDEASVNRKLGAIDLELIDLLIGMAILTAPVLLLAAAAKVILDRRASAQRLQPLPVEATADTQRPL